MTDDLAFQPATISVAQGQRVRWVNGGTVAHTVTAYQDGLPAGATYFASGGFDSERAARNRISQGLIGADDHFEHVFEHPGRYRYYCIPHESTGMLGTVRVG